MSVNIRPTGLLRSEHSADGSLVIDKRNCNTSVTVLLVDHLYILIVRKFNPFSTISLCSVSV